MMDGAGPSHLFVRGRALIVVDPNEGVVRRYLLDSSDQIASTPTACAMPRNFSPRYVQPYALGVQLLGEDPHPEAVASNAHLPVLDLTDARLAGMQVSVPRANLLPCGTVIEQPTSVPAEARVVGNAFQVSPAMGVGVPAHGALTIGPDEHAELLSARPIGSADGYGPAIIRREIGHGQNGTIDIAIWVTLFRDTHPSSIRLLDHSVTVRGEVTGLVKRAFDFAAVAGHSLYILGTTCGEGFCITRYDLSALLVGSRVGNNPVGSIDLTGGASEHAQDAPQREADHQQRDDTIAASPAGEQWSRRLADAVGRYAFIAWSYPTAARSRPCRRSGIPDECRLRMHGPTLVDADDALPEDGRVSQDGDSDNARWIGPRHLIDASAPPRVGPAIADAETGIPYSYGGNISAAEFVAAVETTERPIGHIRELLEGPDSDHYPIGIDCSRFVGRIFGIVEDTAGWIDSPPAASVARVVPDLRDARPGDIIVKRGHIVIFSRRVTYGANRAVEVFEASSRCGRVCRSVYDPDFFNGWRIMRLREMAGDEVPAMANPYWPELEEGR
jgi:hypothetical protein